MRRRSSVLSSKIAHGEPKGSRLKYYSFPDVKSPDEQEVGLLGEEISTENNPSIAEKYEGGPPDLKSSEELHQNLKYNNALGSNLEIIQEPLKKEEEWEITGIIPSALSQKANCPAENLEPRRPCNQI
jgi:hypothetical protein